ncbi:MAG: hypothetical protein AB1782_12900 [Cyanobacteriota bacterium]
MKNKLKVAYYYKTMIENDSVNPNTTIPSADRVLVSREIKNTRNISNRTKI